MTVQSGLEMVVAVLTICITAGSIFKRAIKPLSDGIEKLNSTLEKNDERFTIHEKESAIVLTNHADRIEHLENSHASLTKVVEDIKTKERF